jgi:type IV pilus assembly protein PilW
VVLTSSVNPENSNDATPVPTSNLYKTITGTTAALKFLTQSEIGPSNVKASSDLKSDQFTIQFMPEYIIEKRAGTDFYVGGFDCEGNELAYVRRTDSRGRRIVVQRYFLREDSNKNAKEPNATLALACDAGTYEPAKSDGTEPPTKVENFGDNGQIIMKRVDYFHILLGVDQGADFRYMTAKDYMAITTKKPRIVSVQLGILARSAQSVGRDNNTIKDNQNFTVLDKTVSVKEVDDENAPKYVRQVVSQTVAMRNGLGDR